MKRQSIHLFVTAILALLGPMAGQSRGNFVLYNDEQFTVNSSHNQGTLYDTSRVFIVLGGWVYYLDAFDSSTVDFSGGYVGGDLQAYNSSTVGVSGGSITHLKSWHSSAVDISGGFISALHAHNSSAVGISGGSIYSLCASNSSAMGISGGSIVELNACDSSAWGISGGSITRLGAYNSSAVTFYGRDFSVSGGLILDGDRVLGTGILSGEWMDGTPWAVNIYSNEPAATILAVPGPTVIPAPGAVVLAGIGVGCIHWLRRRRAL